MAEKDFNGDIVMDGVSDYISDLFEKIPDEWKADIATHISVEATIQGASNIIEGVGILEVAKIQYFDIAMKVMSEEIMEDQMKNN